MPEVVTPSFEWTTTLFKEAHFDNSDAGNPVDNFAGCSFLNIGYSEGKRNDGYLRQYSTMVVSTV